MEKCKESESDLGFLSMKSVFGLRSFSTNSLLAWSEASSKQLGEWWSWGSLQTGICKSAVLRQNPQLGKCLLSSCEQSRIKVELSDLCVLHICSHVTAAVNPAAWNRNLSICICSISNSSLHELFWTWSEIRLFTSNRTWKRLYCFLFFFQLLRFILSCWILTMSY